MARKNLGSFKEPARQFEGCHCNSAYAVNGCRWYWQGACKKHNPYRSSVNHE